jgi:hypothetical protein
MSLNVRKYSFEGPYASTNDLQDKSGVYVIVSHANQTYSPIDCGESATVKTRVDMHDRTECWKRHNTGTLEVAVFYTPNLQSASRIAIEQEILQSI